jgi:hypothetical protein
VELVWARLSSICPLPASLAKKGESIHARLLIRTIIPYPQVILRFTPFAFEGGSLTYLFAKATDIAQSLFIGLITFSHNL